MRNIPETKGYRQDPRERQATGCHVQLHVPCLLQSVPLFWTPSFGHVIVSFLPFLTISGISPMALPSPQTSKHFSN